jgi:hypothetical protein
MPDGEFILLAKILHPVLAGRTRLFSFVFDRLTMSEAVRFASDRDRISAPRKRRDVPISDLRA